MKANELFTGALARVNRDGLCIKKDTIVEVRAVDADDKLIEKGLIGSAHCRPLDDNQFEGGIWCEYLDPIPLTPEILEKNGFSNNYVEDDLSYATDAGGDVIGVHIVAGKWILDEMYFNYFHQLQLAFRLCGIEKEIVL